MSYEKIQKILGCQAENLLCHKCENISKDSLYLPDSAWVDKILFDSNRSIRVMQSMQQIINYGRLSGTGYLSILPVDQGVEHTAGSSFSLNHAYFDPEHIIKLAIEGGCNAVTTSLGVLGSISRKYAHKIPLILKLNHNELLSYPNSYDQVFFSSVKQAYDMGCLGVGATVYFGSQASRRQIMEVSQAFEEAHELGMITILWSYLRNRVFKTKEMDYHYSADLTGQANYLASTIQADIVKQKIPECNGGFKDLQFGKQTQKMYSDLCSDHPIDLTRYQVANNYMGRVGLINSGGASGNNDLQQAVITAVINKRAGGLGLISGRKAFQKTMKEGIKLLNSIQDVYLCKDVSIA